MSGSEQLIRITEKLQQVLRQYDALQKENEKLRGKLLPLKEKETYSLEQIANLEQQVIVLKAAKGKMNDAEKKDLDKRLNAYLKEIEKCISMLSE